MCHLLCFEARCNPADEGGRGGMQAGASHYLVVSAKKYARWQWLQECG